MNTNTKPSEPEEEIKEMAPLNKAKLESLIAERSPRITLLRKDLPTDGNSRSPVWEKFTVVYVDGRPQEFVKCDQCNSIISFIHGGTTSATRHLSSCRGNRSTKNLGQQMSLDQFQIKTVPASAVKALNQAITIGLAKDLKPLGMIKGKGFQHIAQKLVNFGATYQFQNVNKILNHPTTLKRNLPVLVQKETDNIKLLLKTAPSYPSFAFTTDMWTDGCQQRHFLSLCVHYVDENYKLNSHMLAVDEFPEIDKTTINIRKEIERILGNFFGDDVGKVFEMSTAVTDGGSNFVNVFPNRIPCMCHKLNLVMHWMFNDKKPRETIQEISAKKQFVLTGACPEIKNTLTGLKNLVRFFKKSGLNYRLTKSLKQENETRWNSKLRMLESYSSVNAEVKQILLEKNDVVKLTHISDSAVESLIPFLKQFEDCTIAWSHEKIPTIQEVVLRINKLRTHFEFQSSDSAEMKNLKQQGLICFNEYMEVDDIFYAACMLDPRYKRLKFVGDDMRRRAIQLLKDKVNTVSIITPVEISEPLQKKGKFDEYQDSSDDEEGMEKHEVDQYLESKVSGKGDDFDIPDYWKKTISFPKLRKVALEILAIPASQTSDERVFSSTGATLGPRRTELKGTTLSNLTFIHKNYVM